MKYRREIDGLRAVAVLPVILFHAGFKAFEGGFIGVDVFFVISGYLITSIILADMNKGKFSIVTFYERRARRILPALFFVMLCCLPFAWFLLVPNQFKDFSESLAAVSVFSSNILFWKESGYFETAAELKPLLHTWSLSVEEQYYVLFPLFLLALWKLRKRLIFGALIVVAVVSLATAQWGAYNEPAANFFLLPTRGWELAIGALIGFYFLYKREQAVFIASHKIMSEILSTLGLVLICYSVFAFKKSTPFPSLYTLTPTIGTALIIIFSTSETMVGRVLGSKPMVGIGLISYSTYLWHQPLFAFSRHKSIEEPSTSLLLTLSFLSIVLAYFSWRFVEIPFRDKKVYDRKKIFIFAVVGSLFFAVVGLVGHVNDGLKSRFSKDQLKILEFSEYNVIKSFKTGTCFLDEGSKYTDFLPECYKNMSKNSTLIWGDSHAAALSYGFREELAEVSQITASKCPPILGLVSTNRGCYEINIFASLLINTYKPAYIFLNGNWMGFQDWTDEINKKFLHTISEIKRISPMSKIIIIGGPPQWSDNLPTLLFKQNKYLNDTMYMLPQKNTYDFNRLLDKVFENIAKQNDVNFVSLMDILCRDGDCAAILPTENGYTLTSFDYSHLTSEASVLVTKKILDSINIQEEFRKKQ